MKSLYEFVSSFFHVTRRSSLMGTGGTRIRGREAVTYLLTFALGVVMVGIFLRGHITREYQEEMAYWRARQTGIAEDRARTVSEWLVERQADTQLFADHPSVRAVLQAYSEAGHLGRRSAGGSPDLTAVLDDMTSLYSTAGVYVLDRDAHVIARSSRSIPLDALLTEACRAVARSGVTRIDLVGDAPTRSMISFSAAVPAAPGMTEAGQSLGQPLGVALVAFDASQTLFPLAARIGALTRTGETILVRREGDNIIFFSPLLHVPTGSPDLRFPLSTAPMPARVALEGRETFVEYNDYRGVPVLAATQRIPITGWGLVRKIDRAEALEDVRRQAIVEGLAAGLFVILLGGLLVFHRRVVMTRVLKQEERKIRGLLDSAPDAIYIIDPSTLRILGRNRSAAEMDGYSDEDIAHMTAVDLLPPEDRTVLRERSQKGPEPGRNLPIQTLHYRRKNGQLVSVEENQTLVDTGGERIVLSIVRDITERKRAEQELLRVNRALRTISECNQILVRAEKELDLLQEICRVLAGVGGYRMVWVGFVEHDEGKSVRPVAQAGIEDGYLQTANITWADTERGQGPTGTAIRTGKTVVAREMLADPSLAPWREEARKRGYSSSITLPLLVKGRVFGALTIYAADPDAFDSKEVELLTELADDLAYGIQTLRRRTERIRAEEDLYQSRERLKSILDTIPQRVFWKDRNLVYLGCNRALAVDAGLKDPAEIVGKNDYELAWRETAEAYRADDNLVMEQDTPRLGYEEIQNRPDGSVIWLRTNKLPLHDQEGKVIGILGTYEDFTERKQAEAEHIRLVTAIEQSAEAVVITDTKGDIEYVNPAFTRITGYSREEVLGLNPRILNSGKQDQEFYKQLWETILNGQTWNGEFINRRKDGGLYTEQTAIAPVLDAGGNITHFIATKQDVTERKTLEEHVRGAAKMEAIGRLAGGVAHDFNNLLTIINGYTELLLEKFGTDSRANTFLIEVKKAGERAASLTRQLLAFSRRQVMVPQVLDLNAVISNLDKMLNRLIGEDIELRMILDSSLQRVKADPGQVEQVIMNLAVNARDAMPKGGSLTIETTNVELDEDYAGHHATVKPGPHAVLAISDSGVGMTAETQAHIFEPFFTTKAEGKGTGLGLATVYGIVKQSGASVWVYSELGQGTVFKVYFPVVNEGLTAAEITDAEMDLAPGTETILVVEDQGGVRSLIRMALESVGYKVLETGDAESVPATCATYDGPIHLLLTDIVMPGLSGPLVAAKVTALLPDIKVLYMSGYTDDAVVHHGVLNHDVPFIQKPFSPSALRKMVRKVLGRK